MALALRIIPCLDVNKGRVVKGTRFLDLKDAGDPVSVAKRYDVEGADEVIFLDITASSDNRKIMLNVVKACAEQIFIPLTVGGGVRNLEDIRTLLQSGADKVSMNTAAVQNPDLINKSSDTFGSQCIVLAIDAKRTPSKKWNVFIHGGRTDTQLDAIEWAKKGQKLGAGEILLTSMDRDGTKAGYDLELIERLTSTLTIPVIASGGAGTLDHFYSAWRSGASACLAASLFHYNQLSIAKVKKYLKIKGVPIRI